SEPGEGMKPFALPDFYIRTVNLRLLSFDRIKLSPAVAGAPYSLSPALQGRVTLGRDIAADLKLKPGLDRPGGGVPAPRLIEAAARLAPDTLELAIENLSLASDAYSAR